MNCRQERGKRKGSLIAEAHATIVANIARCAHDEADDGGGDDRANEGERDDSANVTKEGLHLQREARLEHYRRQQRQEEKFGLRRHQGSSQLTIIEACMRCRAAAALSFAVWLMQPLSKSNSVAQHSEVR